MSATRKKTGRKINLHDPTLAPLPSPAPLLLSLPIYIYIAYLLLRLGHRSRDRLHSVRRALQSVGGLVARRRGLGVRRLGRGRRAEKGRAVGCRRSRCEGSHEPQQGRRGGRGAEGDRLPQRIGGGGAGGASTSKPPPARGRARARLGRRAPALDAARGGRAPFQSDERTAVAIGGGPRPGRGPRAPPSARASARAGSRRPSSTPRSPILLTAAPATAASAHRAKMAVLDMVAGGGEEFVEKTLVAPCVNPVAPPRPSPSIHSLSPPQNS